MNKIRVLLADDHAIVRAGIRKVVEDLPDIEVVCEVGSGPELRAALTKYQPECLLIDVAMPDFDPIESVKRIRAEYPEMKILVVSAYKDDVYVQGLLAAGVNGYHLKDQSLKDLQLAVQRILEGEFWLSSPLIDQLVRHHEVFTSLPQLTLRQQELLRLLTQGLDNNAIAAETGLSVKTIENHLTRLYRCLHVQSRLEAVNYVTNRPEILGVSGDRAVQTNGVQLSGNPEALTLLIVDDNSRYRQQLINMIGKVSQQVRIYEATTIAEAVQLSRRLSPQLIFMDVVLAGEEDGITCTRRIKAVAPASRILLISAYPDREFHRLGLAAGAVAFLDKKDIDLHTLREVIGDLAVK